LILLDFSSREKCHTFPGSPYFLPVTTNCSQINVTFLIQLTSFLFLRNKIYEKLHDLYSSPSIVRVIKSRIMRWAGHVVRMGRIEACLWFWWGSLERDHWGDPSVDGRIILGWIFRKWDVGGWTGLGWLRIETGGGKL
jgi:hypothetical protein